MRSVGTISTSSREGLARPFFADSVLDRGFLKLNAGDGESQILLSRRYFRFGSDDFNGRQHADLNPPLVVFIKFLRQTQIFFPAAHLGSEADQIPVEILHLRDSGDYL